MPRILGLDVGERYIGVAISTPEGRLAVPLQVLERRGDSDDAAAIAEIARAEGATTLVIGDPISLDGSVGPQAQLVRAFAQRLADTSSLPAELWDERLTTAQAKRSLARPRKRPAGGARRHRPRNDDLAAAIILQGYLDRHSPEP